MSERESSGIKGFDDIVYGLRIGDNVVWQVDDLGIYRKFVDSYVNDALSKNKRVVYIRFAEHPPLVENEKVKVYQLDARGGFESFSKQVHAIATDEGRGVFYVFDCLSDLLLVWATDLMIGNFFMVTCPYLFELDTVAYFSLLRNKHSFKTIARIRETTQLLIDVYSCDGKHYVHPLKVWNRYSPTMFFPHLIEEDKMVPITGSVDTSKLFSYICKNITDSTRKTLDYWDYLFMKVEKMLKTPGPVAEQWEMIEHICAVMMTSDKRMAKLVKKYFTLEDFLNIRSRIIGTGFIGGKAVGLLLARNILLNDKEYDWPSVSEPHDSFYIGSDVFYTYIVQNGWWRLWMEQKTKDGYYNKGENLKGKFLVGKFPDEIREGFHQIIDYFGQSPIIVRSSSIQEDAFGNVFAGKYESVFLCNQGTPEERFEKFVEAVKRVYASTMSEDALLYRKKRGLDELDEQMALLVQRVSGSYHDGYFFPLCAGVGVSNNIFIWENDMDPKQGMLRLVFGLGTRAVDRVEDDYPRTVALDKPLSQPLSGHDNALRFSQHQVDLLDTKTNEFRTVPFDEIISKKFDIPLDLVASFDAETSKKYEQIGKDQETWILDFNKLLKQTPFVEIMKRLLKTLEGVYQYPVDIEFALNISDENKLQLNLLQCRPIQTKGQGKEVSIPESLPEEKVLISSKGSFIGGSISQNIQRVIYIDPKGYYDLKEQDKYMVARLVGKLNKLVADKNETPTMLIGPGRWGTSTPSLGIPVHFSEINKISALCELEFVEGNLSPDLSFGTHFFHDLVEEEIFYIAIFAKKEGEGLNKGLLDKYTNKFNELLPENQRFADIIKVYDTDNKLNVVSDVVSQRVLCYFL